MTSGDPAWTLGATCRCLTEDLGLAPEACNRPITELVDAHQVIADFVKKRGAHPIGTETISALLPQLVAYSLHSGRYRAATWHHEAAGIVWLLAARRHEQGSADDSYPYFEQLLRTGRLLPTRADVERVVDQRRPTFARALLDDVPRMRRAALDHPGQIQDDVIGGRVRACGSLLRTAPPGFSMWPSPGACSPAPFPCLPSGIFNCSRHSFPVSRSRISHTLTRLPDIGSGRTK